jgi:LuxR family maltose regulon positive regulatory protein
LTNRSRYSAISSGTSPAARRNSRTSLQNATIRAVDVALQDDSRAAIALAEPCLRSRGGDPWNINVASNVVRFGLWQAGDLEAFYAVPWIPYADEDDHRNVLSHVYRLCLQGLVEAQQLRFDIAERHLLEALRRGERQVGSRSTCAALPAALLARLRYEQGRLDEAEAMIGDRLPLINATAMLECVLHTYVVLARIAASRSNVERAYALLEQAANLGHTRRWGRLVAAMHIERLRLYIGEGRLIEASASLIQLEALAAEFHVPVRCAWSDIDDYLQLARARMALAKRDAAGAVAILKALRSEVSVDRRKYFGLCLDTLLCVALLDAGESAVAMEAFRNVLSVAEPAGVHRTILDTGPETGLLLSQSREVLEGREATPSQLSYIDRLLDGWRTLYERGPRQGRDRPTADSLTARERGILELIAEGHSNREIAKSLGIAPETVKSHVKNIFGKLAVERRAQAVARAQSIGLLRMAGRGR